MKYRATYKCRMCGKTFIEGTVRKKSVGEATHLLSVEGNSESQYRESQIHFCDNGDVGYADFQGFQKKAPSEKQNMNHDSSEVRETIVNLLILASVLFLMVFVPLCLAFSV